MRGQMRQKYGAMPQTDLEKRTPAWTNNFIEKLKSTCKAPVTNTADPSLRERVLLDKHISRHLRLVW